MVPGPLSDTLAQALDALGRDLDHGWLEAGRVAGVLSELDRLPASSAPTVERTLPQIVRLGSRSVAPPRRLRWIGAPRTERELLADEPELAWIFLFHRSGFLRQAALDALPGAPRSSFFIAAVALRLNDWVPQVRAAASRAFDRLLADVDPVLIAGAAHYLATRRRSWQRWDAEATQLDLVLQRQDVAERLSERLLKEATGALPSLLQAILRYPSLDRWRPELARSARQPGVRAVALKTLLAGAATWPGELEQHWIDKSMGKDVWRPRVERRPLTHTPPVGDLIDQGLADRSGAVRRIAMAALIQHPAAIPDLDVRLQALSADPSWPVRWRAEFLIRERAATTG